MSEKLQDWDKEGQWRVDENGDIKPLGDYGNYEELPDRPELPTPTDTSMERNDKLLGMIDAVAKANRAVGALKKGISPRTFGSVERAESIQRDKTREARRLGREACLACAVAADCQINDGILYGRFKNDPSYRDKFKTQIQKVENATTLCKEIVKPLK